MDTNLERLAERVRSLEDLESIRHSWRDYCVKLDSAGRQGLGDIFTADGVLDMVGLDRLLPGLDGQYRDREHIIDEFYLPAVSDAVSRESTKRAGVISK
jgi:SnoaL-like domain